MKDTIVYDIEIANRVEDIPGGWNNPEAMLLGSAVAYSYNKDHYYFFLHPSSKEKLLQLLNESTVVGFNSIRFDSRVILGNDRSFNYNARWTSSAKEGYGWENYDIMFEYVNSKYSLLGEEDVFKWLDNPANHKKGVFSLNGMAMGTFSQQKSGDGALAPVLYKQARYDELLEYNLRDVILTKKLFDHIQAYGYVIDGNGQKQMMPVEV